MAGYSPPLIDFSALAEIPGAYYKGQDRARENQFREALGSLRPGPNGELDYGRMVQLAGQYGSPSQVGDFAKLADTRATRSQAQSNADRSYNLQVREFEDKANKPQIVGSAETGYYLVDRQGRPVAGNTAPGTAAPPAGAPGTPAPTGPQPIIPAKPKAAKDMPAGDRKAIFEAEDDNANLAGTIDALTRAQALNPQVFTGVTAGARGFLGSKVPGGGMLVDEAGAKATSEWQGLMSQEAIKTMAQTLKGATTDFELRKFEQQLADPSTPPEIRGRVITRMLQLAQRKAQINQTRMDQLRGGSYYKPGGGQSVDPGATTSTKNAEGKRLRFNPASGEFE